MTMRTCSSRPTRSTSSQGTDNGTPLQKDEPHAENPPNGVMIDYYLKRAATTPVVIEILDASGAVIQKFSSDPNAQTPAAGRGAGGRAPAGIPRVSPLWQTHPALPSSERRDASRHLESAAPETARRAARRTRAVRSTGTTSAISPRG